MASFPTSFRKGEYEDEICQKYPGWDALKHQQPVNKVLLDLVSRETDRCMALGSATSRESHLKFNVHGALITIS